MLADKIVLTLYAKFFSFFLGQPCYTYNRYRDDTDISIVNHRTSNEHSTLY